MSMTMGWTGGARMGVEEWGILAVLAVERLMTYGGHLGLSYRQVRVYIK
jgi:hypothetical protein